MTTLELLSMMRLLSAMESAMLTAGKSLPAQSSMGRRQENALRWLHRSLDAEWRSTGAPSGHGGRHRASAATR